MEVQLTPDQEAKLHRLATLTGRHPDKLVQEAIDRYTEAEERFLAAVEQGITSAERGDLIDDDQVRLWLEARERV